MALRSLCAFIYSLSVLGDDNPTFDAYTAAIQAATAELKALNVHKTRIEQRMRKVRQTISTLFRLLSDQHPSMVPNLGLTDAIRDMLHTAATPRTVGEIKELLETMGYDFTGYKNPAGFNQRHSPATGKFGGSEKDSHQAECQTQPSTLTQERI